MTARHVSHAAAGRLIERLSERDAAVLRDLSAVRVLSGNQLARLHFHDLSARSRDRARRRVLERLADLDLVTALERRIGGARAGSAGLVYALGVAGQHVVPLLDGGGDRQPAKRPRQPWTPSRLFLAHTLGVSELYVQFAETARTGVVELVTYHAEPVSWVPNGLGGWVKPDAYLVVRSGSTEDSWWLELDRATESVPTLKRKLLTYLDFAGSGQLGPDGVVVPRVLLTAPNERRYDDVAALLERLPEPASKLFHLAMEREAVRHVLQVLRE